jgi:hypothetical protein
MANVALGNVRGTAVAIDDREQETGTGKLTGQPTEKDFLLFFIFITL